MCRNGNCVPILYRCDGLIQCTDGSDEIECRMYSIDVCHWLQSSLCLLSAYCQMSFCVSFVHILTFSSLQRVQLFIIRCCYSLSLLSGFLQFMFLFLQLVFQSRQNVCSAHLICQLATTVVVAIVRKSVATEHARVMTTLTRRAVVSLRVPPTFHVYLLCSLTVTSLSFQFLLTSLLCRSAISLLQFVEAVMCSK